MPEFKATFVRQRKYMFFLLSFYVLGWGFTPYQPVFLGLFLGTSFSLFNLWLMIKKIDQFGEAVVKGRKISSIGMISRMAMAVLAVIVAMEYPDYLHLISVIMGLMTIYIVIMIDFFIQTFLLRK
ncbi:ATP synthase protein I [Cytobacillus eiseniae]|uniref:ATP synthase protein I n=1 Tax=Cytobacillus eiseniae TaxID=762947 RepID=A0ABS4RJG0_9BACI|nr:ATP synthase subunit I [Cytobacillus eiseniae]MBP2243006.1 ATP synthase protein I [Cytobacillus eiseniae]